MPLPRTIRSQLFLSLVLLIQLIVATPAYAATFRETGDSEGRCQLIMEGAIVGGDAERLRAVIGTEIRFQFALCLNSSGGDWKEAMDMISILREVGVQTYVGDGQRCLSACAMVFLGGARRYLDGPGVDIIRGMHPEAQLGFHAPYIEPGVRTYSNREVSGIFSIAMQVAGMIVEISETIEIPNSFIKNMLGTPADDMLYIDTILEARILGVNLTDIKLPSSDLSGQDVVNICSAVNSVFTEEYFYEQQLKLFRNEGGQFDRGSYIGFQSVGNGGLDVVLCLVQRESKNHLGADRFRVRTAIHNQTTGGFALSELVKIDNDWPPTGIVVTSNPFSFFEQIYPHFFGEIAPEYFRFGDNLRLADLPTNTQELSALQRPNPSFTIDVKFADFRRPVLTEGCWIRPAYYQRGGNLYVSDVNESVNIRSSVGFGENIVGRGILGERLEILGENEVYFLEDAQSVQTCRAICDRQQSIYNPPKLEDRAPLMQCGEDNIMWYQVRSSNGVEGFVSGKYLAYPD